MDTKFWPKFAQYSSFREPEVISDYLNHNIIPGCNMLAIHPVWNRPCVSSSLWEPWSWVSIVVLNHMVFDIYFKACEMSAHSDGAWNSCFCHLCQNPLLPTMQPLSITSIWGHHEFFSFFLFQFLASVVWLGNSPLFIFLCVMHTSNIMKHSQMTDTEMWRYANSVKPAS